MGIYSSLIGVCWVCSDTGPGNEENSRVPIGPSFYVIRKKKPVEVATEDSGHGLPHRLQTQVPCSGYRGDLRAFGDYVDFSLLGKQQPLDSAVGNHTGWREPPPGLVVLPAPGLRQQGLEHEVLQLNPLPGEKNPPASEALTFYQKQAPGERLEAVFIFKTAWL